MDFGAKADGQTLNTNAFAAAARACREAGGGTLLVPPGVYLTGIFEIFSHTTLRLAEGARLVASPQFEDRQFGDAVGGILLARDAQHVRLEGSGVFDGNAPHFFEEDRLHAMGRDFEPERTRQGVAYGSDCIDDGPLRPRVRPGNLLVFTGCTDLQIEGLHFTGATYWTLHLADCIRVNVRRITVENDPRHPNNDGIHLTTCREVVIEDCVIATGDDAISITGIEDGVGETEVALGLRHQRGVSGDITVRRCRLSSHSAAIRLGYGRNPLENVLIEEIEIPESNRGIGIFARQASVRGVVIRNVNVRTRLFHGGWWGCGEPLHLSSVRFPGEEAVHTIRDVRVENFHARSENGIHLIAERDGAIENVLLRDCSITLEAGPLHAEWGGNFDLRPSADPALAIAEGGNAPIWARNVRGLELERFQSTVRTPEAFLSAPSLEGYTACGEKTVRPS
jgi:polygalacturonase